MRILAAIVAVLGASVTLFLAFTTLSLLVNPARDPSAIQVTQVNSEAQTYLLVGILIVLTTIAISLASRGATNAKIVTPSNQTAASVGKE